MKGQITGSTVVTGIFGDPVEHTLSPAMQNAAFAALGLDMAYLPFHVTPERLREAVAGVRALAFAGVNVTVPHKEAVIPLLDDADSGARFMGAVNVIVNTNGRLKGYNTDGPGYLKSLVEETGFDPKGKLIVVVGAGGAARGVIHALACAKRRPTQVVVANRTVDRAASLCREFGSSFGVAATAVGLDEVGRSFPGAALLVNASTAGMGGKGALDLPLRLLPKKAIVSDIVYRPLMTGLLKKADRLGLKIHGGLGMLVHQGALAFALWTGKRAPVEIMRKAALKALGRPGR